MSNHFLVCDGSITILLPLSEVLQKLAITDQGNFMTFVRCSEIKNTQISTDVAQIPENIMYLRTVRHLPKFEKYGTKVKRKTVSFCRLSATLDQ
jgi:hypothetical protein